MEFFGWWKNEGETEKFLNTLPNPLAPLLRASDKPVLLYEVFRKVCGRDLDPGPQKIGDCVSWGFAGSVDLLAAVETQLESEEYNYDLRVCTEAVYALSRVEYVWKP